MEKEIRVFVVDTHSIKNGSHTDLTNEEFMTLSENQGTVHTLESFQKAFNSGAYEIHYVIRFLSV